MLRQPRAVSRVVGDSGLGGATVRGIHAEGPVIATRGGLPDSSGHCAVSAAEAALDPRLTPLAKFERLVDESLGGPDLRVMTISPSLERTTGRQAAGF